MKLTAEMIEAFAGVYLSPRYDAPQPTPDFHRECWNRYCSDYPACATAAPRNHAKAQPLKTKVLTPTGWTTIGELSVGDFVIGSDGHATRVTQLHPIAVQPTYRLETKDERAVLCNDEHLWSVYIPSNTGERLITLSLKELKLKAFAQKPNGYIEYRAFLPLCKPVCFFEHGEELDIPAYMLGVWLGDGHAADGRITSADPEIFNWFDCVVIKQAGSYLYKPEGFRDRLQAAGLLNNKFVPALYLVDTPVKRLALLQGLMDTDGTVHQDGKIAYFCNTNENLVEAVVFIVRSLGGVAVVSITKSAKGATQTSYRVSVKLPKDLCPFRLHRKAALWKGCNNERLSITAIDYVGEEASRCITVAAEDGLYVTEDFLLTHNSTGLTHDFILANVCFRQEDYVILVGASEEMSIEHLGDIANELRENEDLRRDFKIKDFCTEQKTDIVIECVDGHQFRIIARGAEQKIRGRKWRGKRPGLIVCDDLEDDEQVENKDRRRKFRRWFFRACKQALRDGGRIRVHGTILHEDSLLNHLIKNKAWHSRKYKAHRAFNDFTQILWPEKFPADRLSAIQREFVAEGDAAGYSQEYLNDPRDNEEQYIRKDDMLPMIFTTKDVHDNLIEVDYRSQFKRRGCGVDFAVSKDDTANRTSFTIGGKCLDNTICIEDQHVGRWHSAEVIEKFFDIAKRWADDLNDFTFYVEDGVIWKTLEPILRSEMRERGVYLNLEPRMPVKDKAVRGRPFQKRSRAGSMRFDKDAEWYEEYEAEILLFRADAEALADDQFDSTAWLVIGLEEVAVEDDDQLTDDELREVMLSQSMRRGGDGRSPVTGY